MSGVLASGPGRWRRVLGAAADPAAVFAAASLASRSAAGEAAERGPGEDAESILGRYRSEPTRFADDVELLLAAAMGCAEQLGGQIAVIGSIRLPSWGEEGP